jgi:hypothetical protein
LTINNKSSPDSMKSFAKKPLNSGFNNCKKISIYSGKRQMKPCSIWSGIVKPTFKMRNKKSQALNNCWRKSWFHSLICASKNSNKG